MTTCLKPGPDAFFWAGEGAPVCSEESVTGTTTYLLNPDTVGCE